MITGKVSDPQLQHKTPRQLDRQDGLECGEASSAGPTGSSVSQVTLAASTSEFTCWTNREVTPPLTHSPLAGPRRSKVRPRVEL